MRAPILVLFVATIVFSALAPQQSLALQPDTGADGDACEVRPGVPGKVKGLECCSNSDTDDCVVILKPFPEAAVSSPSGTLQPNNTVQPNNTLQPNIILQPSNTLQPTLRRP